jgi:hypothetical protein
MSKAKDPWGDNEPFDDDFEIDREPLCLGCGDDCPVDDDGYCDECVEEDDDFYY